MTPRPRHRNPRHAARSRGFRLLGRLATEGMQVISAPGIVSIDDERQKIINPPPLLVKNEFERGPRYKARPALAPEAHAHWKLKPPSCPVTSTTSPMKKRPGTFMLSMVFGDNSSVSTPPAVTSAFP